MREVGTVELVENGMATVVFNRHEACGSCRACTPLEGEKKMSVVLKNTPGARVGDRVTVELRGGTMLSATAIAYGIPLLMLILGAVLGEWLRGRYGRSEIYTALIAIGSAAMGYGILRLLNPVFSRKGRFSPEIRDIIRDEL